MKSDMFLKRKKELGYVCCFECRYYKPHSDYEGICMSPIKRTKTVEPKAWRKCKFKEAIK